MAAPRDREPLRAILRGGRGGIRTLETLAGLAVFKTAAFNHSATLPRSILRVLPFCTR